MIALTAQEATNLNAVFGVILNQTQSDELPAFYLDDRAGTIVVFKLHKFEESIGDDLEDIGLESAVEDDYLIIKI